jgi:hypothetical protein
VTPVLLEYADTLTELSFSENENTYSGLFSFGPQLTSLKSLRAPLYTLACWKEAGDRTDDELAAGLVNALPQSIEHLWVDLPNYVRDDESIACYFTGLYEECRDGISRT